MNLAFYSLYLLAFSAAAFWMGRYVERSKWNDLIDDGILPRPRAK